MSYVMILTGVGLILIYLEFFVPGGILAILGALALIASIVVGVVYELPTPLVAGWLVGEVFLVVLVVRFALWRISKDTSNRGIYLSGDQQGYRSPSLEEEMTGKTGTTVTALTPSGRIEVEKKSFQAISEGNFIPKGATVIIVRVRGSTLIVKHHKEE